MSETNQSPKPDLNESINVTEAHAKVVNASAAARENNLSESGRESVPLWVIAACGVVTLIAGGVLGQAGNLFSYSASYKEGYVRAKAPGVGEDGPQPKTALAAYSAKGAKIYSAKCNGCHGSDGKGDGANYPSLAGSEFVTKNTELFAMVVLNGIQGPVSNGKVYGAGIMPAQASGMTPEDLAGLMTYVRNSFGNSTNDIVTPEMAKAAFEISAARAKAGQSVTADEVRGAHDAMLIGAEISPDLMVNPVSLAPIP